MKARRFFSSSAKQFAKIIDVPASNAGDVHGSAGRLVKIPKTARFPSVSPSIWTKEGSI